MPYVRSNHEMLQLIVIGCLSVFPHFAYSSYNIALGKPASQSTEYSGWTADKAVDGIIGKDVGPRGGGSCSSTNPTKSRDAWWRVDLQEMSRIKTINITYRELYPFRLSGFYLYVSNTTAVDNLQNTSYMCYHDDTKDPDLPTFNQSRPCSVNGEYVIFYNKRPADNGPKSHQYYSTVNAVVELCEVQVFGCPLYHFGTQCETKCHCGMGGCDPDTGLCDVRECQSGWMGPTCSEECGSGTFGINCNQTCHCFITGCGSNDGTCIVPGCKTGWQGNACDKACGTDKFGKDCLETCHCALPGCDRFNGSCTHTGCASGWTGRACDKVCTTGQFGKDCQRTCHCASPGCNRFSGQCYQTGCDVGWEDPACDQKCGIGRYGKDCKYNCNCATPGCDAITGNCTVPGCAVGWKGSTCDIACNITSFGSNCNKICYCRQPGCDRFTGLCNVTGCVVGWQGPACDQVAIQIADDNQGPSLGGIIGGACSAVAALIVIVIITVTMIRRKQHAGIPSKRNDQTSRMQRENTHTINRTKDDQIYVNMAPMEAELVADDKNHREEPLVYSKDEMDAEEDEVVYVNNPLRASVINDTNLKVTNLHDIIARKNEDETFDTEYQNLPHGLVHPHDTSKAPENIIRNRFKTTFAYDHSRVILRKEKEGLSDYINANEIEDTKGIKSYIATQGPKVTTLEDFWRMVWQKQSGKIIMLANLVELGKKKCAKYWEGEESNSLQLGLYQVTLQQELLYAFYTIRKVSVRNKQTNAKRQITQFHFTKWPDHGVPEAFELLQFHKHVQSTSTDLDGPLIVHCSAGIGRTGTYIGLDALLKDGKENDEIDVFAYTKRMRKDRMNMIQTLDQYVVLHDVLAEGLGILTQCMTGTDFSKNLSDMVAEGIVEKQFKALAIHRPQYQGEDIKTAVTNTNKRKNKDLAILAVERYRVYLTSSTSDYINAINVPSHRAQYGYILTQHPLHNTVVDFWSMVPQQAVDVIVSIGTPQGDAKWPTKDGDVGTFGDFTVMCDEDQSQTLTSDVVIKRKFSLQNKKTTTRSVVTMLETPSWNGSLPSTKTMLELVQQVLNSKGTVTSPIIMTCSNGSTESGLLCVLCNLMERLAMDGEVDIMAAARQLQIRRPQCLQNMVQYEFCYKVMKDNLDNGCVFVNF